MAEVPSVLFHLERYAELGIAGISIGSNDLTQLMLGADRDSELVAEVFDERDPAVAEYLRQLIPTARELGLQTSICGQAPSVHPEYAELLVARRASTRSRSTWTPSTAPGAWSPRPSGGCCSTPPGRGAEEGAVMGEQLTALDATFLELEEADQSAHMHIGGVMVFEPQPGGGAPPLDQVRERRRRAAAGPAALRAAALRARGPAACAGRAGRRIPTSTSPATCAAAGCRPRAEIRELLEWAGEYYSRAARPHPAALGDGRADELARRPLGAGHQDPPLHGRRRRLGRRRPRSCSTPSPSASAAGGERPRAGSPPRTAEAEAAAGAAPARALAGPGCGGHRRASAARPRGCTPPSRPSAPRPHPPARPRGAASARGRWPS